MRKFKKSGRRVAVPFLPGSVETWCLCRIRCVALRLRPGPGPPFSRYAIANEQVIRNRNTLDGSRSESITSNGSEIVLRQEPTDVESDHHWPSPAGAARQQGGRISAVRPLRV